jgi:hypothetical protein
VHGSAPDIAGLGIANPTAMLLAGCMMLEHLEQHEVAQRVRAAVRSTLEARQTVTPDVGGTARTEQFTDAVIRRAVLPAGGCHPPGSRTGVLSRPVRQYCVKRVVHLRDRVSDALHQCGLRHARIEIRMDDGLAAAEARGRVPDR